MNTIRQFWARVDKSKGLYACWPYTGYCDKDGYGHIGGKLGVKTGFLAHRVAFWLTKGKIRDGSKIRHTCDNPPCCNPKHLRQGSHQDNMDDMIRRERDHKAFGENNGRAKFTEDEVRRSRKMY